MAQPLCHARVEVGRGASSLDEAVGTGRGVIKNLLQMTCIIIVLKKDLFCG